LSFITNQSLTGPLEMWLGTALPINLWLRAAWNPCLMYMSLWSRVKPSS